MSPEGQCHLRHKNRKCSQHQTIRGQLFVLRLKSIDHYGPANLFYFVIFFHLVQVIRGWSSRLLSWKIWKAQSAIFSCIVKAKFISSCLKETFKKTYKDPLERFSASVNTLTINDKAGKKLMVRNDRNILVNDKQAKINGKKHSCLAWDFYVLLS